MSRDNSPESSPDGAPGHSPDAPGRAPRAKPDGPMPVLVVGRPQLVSTSENAVVTTDGTEAPPGYQFGEDRDGSGSTVGSAAARRAMAAGAPAISSDGRYVAFVSESGDLVMGDANGAADVFVRDIMAGRTVLVSRSIRGTSGAGSSLQPAISADGRYVAFTSSADDLVEDDTNGSLDVFVHDLRTGVTVLVSRGTNGELANHDSFSPSLSADGRFVAFSSLATNLDPGDTNPSPDVYMHDRLTGRTVLVSAGSDGRSAGSPSGQPSISADGRLIAFTTLASLSPEDGNDVTDVYVHDMDNGENHLVSKSADGSAGNAPSHGPSISADGAVVAFTSDADNLVDGDANRASDVYVHHRPSGTTELASRTTRGASGDAASHSASLSGDGTRVAFLSQASDLAPGASRPAEPVADGQAPAPTDRAYVRDLSGAGTALVSSTRDRTPGDGESRGVAISSWGRHVAFADTSHDLAGQPPAEDDERAPYVYAAGIRVAHLPGPSPVPVDPQAPTDPQASADPLASTDPQASTDRSGPGEAEDDDPAPH